MQKLFIGIMLIVLLFVEGLFLDIAMAVDPDQPFRIGSLSESWGPTPQDVGLRDGLEALGYRENEDFFLGIRFTQGDHTALLPAARELVQDEVALIFTATDLSTKAAKLATRQIPIVFATVSDPIGSELVNSFSKPGGNITGLAELALDLDPKRLQLFHEAVPGLRRVLFPYDATAAGSVKEAKRYRDAAHQLGIELVERPVHGIEEIQTTLSRLRKGDVDGVLAPRCCTMNIPGLVLDLIPPKAIPTMFDSSFWMERGALLGFGQDYDDSGKQAARLVDKILKGAEPSEIPVEVNSKVELTINLKQAKAMGLTIPLEVLYQADRVIQ